ncbi:Flp1 family type IVb pilin [Konateibacter massiliensis]|uniref:Flp1 family type IVb pilin n=1 Tax=Konateibacter massiliensis TaxID=2002841 RepID=UPI000C14A7BE|nr:Flp1 family type IVb pilin [Konateibacter massiliensis]
MNTIKRFMEEEDGVGVVEVILILVVLIALVAIFKDQLEALVRKIFEKINSNANAI